MGKVKLHPGIRIDRISPRGGAGLVFVIAVLTIFLIGVPETRPFLLTSVVAGAIIASVLHRRR